MSMGLPYHVTYPMMHLVLPSLTVKRHTPVETLPTFIKLSLRPVITRNNFVEILQTWTDFEFGKTGWKHKLCKPYCSIFFPSIVKRASMHRWSSSSEQQLKISRSFYLSIGIYQLIWGTRWTCTYRNVRRCLDSTVKKKYVVLSATPRPVI